MTACTDRARVASLAHGLAHEIAALKSAHFVIDRALRGKANALQAHEEALRVLDGMIRHRKGRVADLGAQVAAHG